MSAMAENSQPSAKADHLTDYRFKAGAPSPNPSGRPKGVARVFRELVDLEVAAKGLLDLATSAKSDRDRIAAWRELLDRGYGKAPAFAAVEGYDPLELDEVASEIQRIADDLRAKREAKAAA